MTSQSIGAKGSGIEAELDRLTYSAYLLILDPTLALSVVMTAVAGAEEGLDAPPDLLRRTVEFSLAQLRHESPVSVDREASAFEVVLYAYSAGAPSKRSLSLKETMRGNPVLLLDSKARIAFVLHHVLGYTTSEAARMAKVSEKELHAHLRKAYLQLASLQFGLPSVATNVVVESALA
jgi:hypothetical protein